MTTNLLVSFFICQVVAFSFCSILPVIEPVKEEISSVISACGKYKQSSGYFQSFPFPNYSKQLNCFYNFTVEEGYQIAVEFIGMFQISKYGEDCDADYLEFYDGDQTSSPVIGRYCGYSTPSPIVTSSNKLLVRIRTDPIGTDIGFNAHFYETIVPTQGTTEEVTTTESTNSSVTTKTTTTKQDPSIPIKGPGIVINNNNNNNMFLDFDWTKFIEFFSNVIPNVGIRERGSTD